MRVKSKFSLIPNSNVQNRMKCVTHVFVFVFVCVYVVKGFKLYQQNQKGHFFYPTTENLKKHNSYGFSER